MKTQLLVYRKQGCGFAETTVLTIREFSNASAFDAFELTVIDLQDENLWKCDPCDVSLLKDHADIASISQMVLQSKNLNASSCFRKTVCIHIPTNMIHALTLRDISVISF